MLDQQWKEAIGKTLTLLVFDTTIQGKLNMVEFLLVQTWAGLVMKGPSPEFPNGIQEKYRETFDTAKDNFRSAAQSNLATGASRDGWKNTEVLMNCLEIELAIWPVALGENLFVIKPSDINISDAFMNRMKGHIKPEEGTGVA